MKKKLKIFLSLILILLSLFLILGTMWTQPEAGVFVDKNQDYLSTLALKIEKIPQERRKKAMLLRLGPEGPLTPGGDAFHTKLLKLAGGVPGVFGGADNELAPVSLEQWRKFAPDFVYTVSSEYGAVQKLLERSEWRDVPAVKNGRIVPFADELVSQASEYTGYFASWLASEMYPDEFANEKNLVHPMKATGERPLSIDVPYVRQARIVESVIMDFTHKTLLVDFKRPQRIISTNSGQLDGIMTVGNSYSPPQTWGIYHKLGFERSQSDLFQTLDLDEAASSVMVTGADMDNVVIKTASYRDMTATAIVTAGVESNALRTSKDTGAWYEPGTINILLMTNHQLTDRALARAIVTITEAKTAALWDMDIRSARTRAENPATGTGTDTVVVVSGEGVPLNGSGGHAKMGELIAGAVHQAVREALLKQNGKAPRRGVAERLRERGIYIAHMPPDCAPRMEALLRSPNSAARGFMEATFSVSDAFVMGQVSDLRSFNAWALAVASETAGRPVEKLEDVFDGTGVPEVLDTALDALLTGIRKRDNP
ncbi:MAG: adenosylcobinamide amidohydrolase [Synergistaceae bacterium]|jgi:adenosylcobinamide amidohydrolase|nr:adenosylcobinamide amidohydrolase [Synergistaceae bacterium]